MSSANPASQRKILFVDDDLLLLGSYRKAFMADDLEWQIDYVDSAARALTKMAQVAYDAVIVDLVMPVMDGGKLLREIAAKYPLAVRIAVSEQEKRAALQQQARAHQHLTKPCDLKLLKEALNRAFAASALLPEGAFKGKVAGLQNLPTPPAIYGELLMELNKPEPSMEKVGDIINKDLALSAKLLQMVNSAFFALPRAMSSPLEAAMFLGTHTVSSLVLSIQTFTQTGSIDPALLSTDRLWQHSWMSGVFARKICEIERQKFDFAEAAFIAALLHDVGKLVMALGFPEEFRAALELARDSHRELWEAEWELYQSTHAEIGGYLLGLWGLGPAISESVAFHHRPQAGPQPNFSPLTVVHVANLLANRVQLEFANLPTATQEYLTAIGCKDKFDGWQKTCQEAQAAEKPV